MAIIVDENKENNLPKKGVSPSKTIKDETSSTKYGPRASLKVESVTDFQSPLLDLCVQKCGNGEKSTSNTKKRNMLKAVRRLSAVGLSGVDQEELRLVFSYCIICT